MAEHEESKETHAPVEHTAGDAHAHVEEHHRPEKGEEHHREEHHHEERHDRDPEKPVPHVARGEDVGELVERKYNAGVKSAGSGLWAGVKNFAASGFGKGVLYTAAAVLVSAAVIFGFGASMGEITLGSASGLTTTATTGHGIMIGIGQGLRFLTEGPGLALMAVGGVVGNVVRKHRESAEVAAFQAGQVAKERELALSRRKEKTVEKDKIPDDGYVAEYKRRDAGHDRYIGI